MANAPVPRPADWVRDFAHAQARIRRLENSQPTRPLADSVAYTLTTEDLSAAASWTPDFSTATSSDDGAKMTWQPSSFFPDAAPLTNSGLVIAPGWVWWATIMFWIKTTGAPEAGDFLVYAGTTEPGITGHGSPVISDSRAEMLVNSSETAQQFTSCVQGVSGSGGNLTNGGVPTGPALPAVASALGTEFTPTELTIAVTGIRLLTDGFWTPTGGGD